jgi:tRNA dimethylallyltransferase
MDARKLCGLKMPLPDIPSPLVVIVGPTAVGKTEISLQLAERLDGEIVSMDSRLFYRGMDIGTAKPSYLEQARVSHHLIDVAEPDEVWSLADFQRAAREVIQGIHQRRKLPFLVGGTGQYVRAVIEGWDLPEQEADVELRTELEKWAQAVGAKSLHERLAILDPEAAQVIQYQNVRRTVRALEVIFRTGRRFSEQRQRSQSPYSLLVIGLIRPRPELYARLDDRIEQMIAQGFLDEVRELLAKGYSTDLPTMSAIGYREITAHLRGEISLDEAVIRMKRSTRDFVRRQANWFKTSDPNIHWFEVGADTVTEVERLIRSDRGWILSGGKSV